MAEENNSENKKSGDNRLVMSAGFGMVIGAGLGPVVGVIFDILPFGISIGSAIGLTLGAVVHYFRMYSTASGSKRD